MLFGFDWGHKDGSIASYDGNKAIKKLPDPTSDMVIATENMPKKDMKPYLDAGARMFRCPTVLVKKYRDVLKLPKKLEKDESHTRDACIIYELYKHRPELFREFKWDQEYESLNRLVSLYKKTQKIRIAVGNQLWASPGDEYLTAEYEDMTLKEKKHKKEISKRLDKLPIWTNFLKDVAGIDSSTAAQLVSYVGDINRFQSLSEINSYFGLGVKDGNAPRKKAGQIANWHQDGRSLLLGIIGPNFVKQKGGQYISKSGTMVFRKQGMYRDVYEKRKAFELAKEGIKPIVAERRAIRYAVKVFFRKFYRSYKSLTK